MKITASRTCPRWNTAGSARTIFAEELEGAELVDNHSVWRRFPVLRNARWFRRNRVLVGDALHTAHFSIGSGTRLALEDVLALVKALRQCDFDVARALPAFQAAREPVLTKLTGAALRSANWYERFGEHMRLDPWPFALSYIMRSGRLDGATLAAMSPGLLPGVVRPWHRGAGRPVKRDAPGAHRQQPRNVRCHRCPAPGRTTEVVGQA